MTKQHRRARFIPSQTSGEGAWDHTGPERLVPIGVSIHHWSDWKALTRAHWARDPRLVGLINPTVREWADAFVRHLVDAFDIEAHVVMMDARDVLAEQMYRASPKGAYRIATGMALEMHDRLEGQPRSVRDAAADGFKNQVWGVYLNHFGSAEQPSHEVYI